MTAAPPPSGAPAKSKISWGGPRWTLVAGPHYRAPDLSVIDGIEIEAHDVELLRTTYHDTADLRILRWGGELRHEPGRGWTVILGSGDSGALHVTRVHTLDGSAAVPRQALDLLTGFTRRAPVRPVLHTRTERRETSITAGGVPLGSLRDDLVTVMHGRRIATRFRELEVSGVDGVPERGTALVTVVAALRAAGAAPAPRAGTAVRAMGAPAAAPPDVAVPPASRHVTAIEAIRRAIAQSVSRLVLHDAAVREGSDPEGVHQARVATRRLRSDLRTFAPLLDAERVARMRDELHAVGDVLGEVRDADVLLGRMQGLSRTLPGGDVDKASPLLAALVEVRESARSRLLEVMRGEGYSRLLDDLVSAAADPPALPEASGDAAAMLPPLARGPWRKLRRRVETLPPDPPDSDLHEVRILAKRARYAAEAVAPVSRSAVGDFAEALAAIQEVLGDHHDAVVGEQWLRETGSARNADALVLGELIGLERAAAAAARARWPQAWKAARRAHPRSWT